MDTRSIIRVVGFSFLALVVFGLIDDFLFTLAADLTESRTLQYAMRASVISFSVAFVAAYFARKRIEWIVVALVTTYWIAIANYRYSTAISLEEIGFFEFVAEGLRSILPSIFFSWLGAYVGWRYWAGADSAEARVNRRHRTALLALIFVLLFAITPFTYNYYWQSQATEQVRIAVRAIEAGSIPENVYPFDDVLIHLTPYVESLVSELNPETQFVAGYKNGMGFHSYEVEIWPTEESRYTATASFSSWDGWKISCCLKVD